MCYLRGDCRPGDSGEPAIDKNGPGSKREKQEKVEGLIWRRLLILKNTIWSSALFVMEKGNYLRILGALMFVENAGVLGSLKGNREKI